MSTPPRTPSKSKDADDKPVFSERELKHIIAAMMSLKTGIPEVDYSRFQKHGEFNTLKTAQNTWGVLKKKLIALNPDMGTEGAASTPKKTPAKRTKKVADEGDDAAEEEEGTAKKKAKTPRKKKADADAEDEEAGTGSPAKKKATPKATPKKTPAKKAAPKKSEATIKEEDVEDAGDAAAPAAEEPKTPPPAAEDIKMEDGAED